MPILALLCAPVPWINVLAARLGFIFVEGCVGGGVCGGGSRMLEYYELFRIRDILFYFISFLDWE